MTSNNIIEKHIEIDQADITAVDALSSHTSLSKQTIKQAMAKGAVWLSRGKHTQRLRRATRKLNPGDSLHLYYNAEILAMQPAEALLVADEGNYSVWYKPSGMLSQGSKWSDHCTIARWASQHLQPERAAFIVHRLDRAASGLILVAHSKKAVIALTQLFQQRGITKKYQAIVSGQFPSSPEVLTLDTPIDDKPAISHVQLVSYSKQRDCSLLNIEIETGRKHQIRKHLSETGFPVLGDRLYSHADKFETDLQLTAVSLSFSCPFSHVERVYTLDESLRPHL